MQRPPLPVDVIPTSWDYFVDGVGVLSGAATAVALIVAALTYRRQVEDASRQQASMVRTTTMRWNFDGPVDGDDSLAVENGSDRSIRVTKVHFDRDIGDSVVVDHKFPAAVVSQSLLIIAQNESGVGSLEAIVDFKADGRSWRLSADNVLLQLTWRDRLRERVENWVVPEERMDALWERRIARGR